MNLEAPRELPKEQLDRRQILAALRAFRRGDFSVRIANNYDGLDSSVPTITLEGDANGAPHPDASAYAKMFSGKYAHREIKGGIGHNLPQEAPQAFAEAVLEVDGY